MENNAKQKCKNEKLITVFVSGAFGIHKHEGKLVNLGRRNYAQYVDRPSVSWIPKGKRKAMGHIATYDPWLVVIEGHGHISPPNSFTPKTLTETGFVVSKTRYGSFDRNYKTEFDAELTQYIAGKNVLIDCRATIGTDFIQTDLITAATL